MNTQITVKKLAYLGIIPFIIGIFITSLKLQETYIFLKNWEIAYGAVIVSFIAGTHWTFCLINKVRANICLHSNIIALLAWCGLLAQNSLDTWILIFCFLYLLAIEYRLKKAGIIEQWYFKMRCLITSLVVGVLVIYVIILLTID